MKKVLSVLVSALVALSLTACNNAEPKEEAPAKVEKQYDIRIFTVANPDKKITTATIEKAFEETGFGIDGNNNMNKPFSKRFNSTWYETYHLATVHNAELVAKLISKYPSIGLLTPLSMSIWSSHDNKDMSISSLTLRGMSRITQIPMTNPDLIAYEAEMTKALNAALPGGHFETLAYAKVADKTQSLETTFSAEWVLDPEEEETLEDMKDDFQSEFEGELEPVGFLFPGFIGVNDEVIEAGVEDFEFYDTYSICKLEVIHPVSKTHPEAGAFAPCSFYMYQRKGEKTFHMGFPSVENWIQSTDMTDEYSLKPLIEAQNLLADTITSILE